MDDLSATPPIGKQYLAACCALGNLRALRAFERHCFAALPAALSHHLAGLRRQSAAEPAAGAARGAPGGAAGRAGAEGPRVPDSRSDLVAARSFVDGPGEAAKAETTALITQGLAAVATALHDQPGLPRALAV